MSLVSIEEPWQLFSGWLTPNESDFWQLKINSQIEWKQPIVCVYGAKHRVPRLTEFLAEKDINYVYSGVSHEGNGWPFWFKPLLEKVQYKCNSSFNGCLLNLYRNGRDNMGWHSDNEPELDSAKPIASLSLGISRDIFFKHRLNSQKKTLKLSKGDLLIMYPSCQENWLHSLPVRKKVILPRLNLTFRCYKTSSSK